MLSFIMNVGPSKNMHFLVNIIQIEANVGL